MSSVLVSLMLAAQPASAQLSAGGGIAGYHIVSVDGSGDWLGAVIVIDADATDYPDGFTPGSEYWYFADAKAAPYAGMLIAGSLTVDTDKAKGMMISGFRVAGTDKAKGMVISGMSLPPTPSSYAVYDHESFDPDDVQTFPTVSLSSSAWTVSLYRADQIVVADGLGTDTESSAERLGWMAFDGGVQRAWADAEYGETLLDWDADEGLLFIESVLPEAGTEKVCPAR